MSDLEEFIGKKFIQSLRNACEKKQRVVLSSYFRQKDKPTSGLMDDERFVARVGEVKRKR